MDSKRVEFTVTVKRSIEILYDENVPDHIKKLCELFSDDIVEDLNLFADSKDVVVNVGFEWNGT